MASSSLPDQPGGVEDMKALKVSYRAGCPMGDERVGFRVCTHLINRKTISLKSLLTITLHIIGVIIIE